MVGLPDNAVKESHERIVAAIHNCGYRYPTKQIVVNLAPADIKKEGSAYDLPLAIGILAANEQLPADSLNQFMILGELSLDGSLKPVQGVLPIAINARAAGFHKIILPRENANEAAIVKDIEVYGFQHIREVVDFIHHPANATPITYDPQRASIVFPEPGGPTISRLCMPAAAISKARFTLSCPLTSLKSYIEFPTMFARCGS